LNTCTPSITCASPVHAMLGSKPHNDISEQRSVALHVANVGDCRAVICQRGKAVAITRDHKPDLPDEMARIEAAGGYVSRGRVNGTLGVSRSFGDIMCKVYPPQEEKSLWEGQQVIAQPELFSLEV
ncbi:unnamed protein product, partial [Choristocarpus tenellus]